MIYNLADTPKPPRDCVLGARAMIHIINDIEYIKEVAGGYKITPSIDLFRNKTSLRSNPERKRIFISCSQLKGQKKLGQNIKNLIDSTCPDFEGYFAENEHSLEGLTNNIFTALYKSFALIAIMHKRGKVINKKGTNFRGSVWIEQEIAIAAFMKQTLDIDLPVIAYIQNGIELEGIRQLIILNPKHFDNDQEILDDLAKELPARITHQPTG